MKCFVLVFLVLNSVFCQRPNPITGYNQPDNQNYGSNQQQPINFGQQQPINFGQRVGYNQGNPIAQPGSGYNGQLQAVNRFGLQQPNVAYNRPVNVNSGPGLTVKDEDPIKFPPEVEEVDRTKIRPNPPSRSPVNYNPSTTSTSTQYDPITAFSLNLFKFVSSSAGGNMAVCPISVSTLLAILMQGAQGNTLAQLEKALFYNQKDAVQAYSSFFDTKRSNSRNELSMANAIMVKQGIEVQPQFKNLALRNFKALFDTIDYRNLPMASTKLNNWISQQTKGKINNLFTPDSLQDKPQMLLMNAVYFKGIWKTVFNPRRTTVQSFNTLPGQEYDTEFMYQTGIFPAGLDQKMGAKWVELPFEGEDLSMIFILPVRQHELNELIGRLSLDDLKTMISTRNMLTVNMAIPKFNISSSTNLGPHLFGMGIENIFTSNSQLSGIANGDTLVVQKALQKVVMSIDEQGAKAAAGTVLTVNTLSLASINDEFLFTANQPFVVVLVDKINQLPLFLARISKP